MKFVLLVEGQTERQSAGEFLKRWLDPQLAKPVGISISKFNGYADLANKMASRAKMHLEGPRQAEIVAVIALLDLYIPDPNFYPADRTSADDRYAWGKDHFEKDVGKRVSLDKFRFFFAVHEFEAWLLSDISIFPKSVQNALPKNRIAQPERVDFGEHPAQLLERTYLRTRNASYKKTVDGQRFFAKLDPTVAAQKCPRLAELLEEMLRLAHAAGL